MKLLVSPRDGYLQLASVRTRASAKRRISTHGTAYSFRHDRITDLLQIYGVDPLTVAAQTGTSIAMIEKAYLRFIPSAMLEKLADFSSLKQAGSDLHLTFGHLPQGLIASP
jgi:integrase